MPASHDLSGHVAIVTGANHGIGAATARTLGACGAGVLVSFLRLPGEADAAIPDAYNEQRSSDAEAVVAGIRDAGGRAMAVEADLAEPTTPARLFDAAEAELGPVDILVNNASAWRADSFRLGRKNPSGHTPGAVEASSVATQLSVDARAAALLIAELARRIEARGGRYGRIIGLTSGGPNGFPGEVSYGAAKAALENYTMSAAIELADLGITANIVYPPVTDTGWVNDDVRRFVDKSPLHTHVAAPEEVAAVIAYLASVEARLVTGNVLKLR